MMCSEDTPHTAAEVFISDTIPKPKRAFDIIIKCYTKYYKEKMQ